MSESKENLTALEIDIAQWRREIETFVEMTVNELAAVNESLASRFTNSTDQSSGTRLFNRRTRQPEAKANQFNSAENSSGTDDRLAELKHKLARKIGGEGGVL